MKSDLRSGGVAHSLDNRFKLASDLRTELLDHKRQLEQLSHLECSISAGREPPPPLSPRGGPASFWRRLRRLIGALLRVGRTNARVDSLSNEIFGFRKDIVAEVASLRTSVFAGLQQLTNQTELQAIQVRDLELQQATQVGDLERQVELLSDKCCQELVIFRHELARERRIRQSLFTEFDRHLRLLRYRGSANEAIAVAQQSPNLNALLESFYSTLEERYRGSRSEVKQRLLIYRNDLRAARERTGANGPVFDLGCGRGEMLEVLREDNFNAVGIDHNATQLEDARRHGAAVVQQDVLTFLREVEAGTVLAVTGIHIIEHICFADLAALMQEVSRVLRPGGVAIFETPNPRNLIVGATTFNLDPTHIRPIPAEVMEVLFDVIGFSDVERRFLHPSDTLAYAVQEKSMDPDLAALLYGSQDYAIIGKIGGF